MVTGTLESILENATHWSTHSMAWAEGLTQNAVLRIWQAFGLKPHLQETFKLSTARLDVHLVMNNYATHKTPKVAAWFRKRPRYHLHFTPTSAALVNQVERWFAKITDQRIRWSAFLGVNDLEQAIADYIANNNAKPKPFVWTATADLILG